MNFIQLKILPPADLWQKGNATDEGLWLQSDATLYKRLEFKQIWCGIKLVVCNIWSISEEIINGLPKIKHDMHLSDGW